jgi:hypothetical protein
MAELIYCKVYEEKVVASLCRPHIRSDNKLTATERERLTNAVNLTWSLKKDLKTSNDLQGPSGMQQKLARLQLKKVFCAREAAIFIVDNVPEPQEREIARLMGEDDDEKWDANEFRARLMDVVRACTQCLENKGKDRYSQPYRAPLGYFGMFDHWQEDYMEWFDLVPTWNARK